MHNVTSSHDHINTVGVETRQHILFNVQGSAHRKYIPIYIQQNAMLHSLFISGNCSTYFGCISTYHQEHKTVSTASGTCQTVTATCRYRGVPTLP